MLKFYQVPFNELTTVQLYQLLQLRNEVFIIEQNTPYQDLDNKDQEAIHFLCFDNDILVGYGRVLLDNDKNAMSLGRLITKATHRKCGIAKELMKNMLHLLDDKHSKDDIVISAQTYLEKFYQSFDFISTGREYLEDGLPHIKMLRSAKIGLA